jgi:perosamine synthetase
MIIPHSKPYIDKEDIESVKDVLISGYISQGEKVREFEKKIATIIGTKYGIASTSGTSALHLSVLSLGLKKGDEVILPSYVCSSPYMAIKYAGAKPKIVDIDLSDFNISVNSIKKALTSKTKAMIIPHMFGTPAELDEILEIGIPIIENCAHSIGAEYKKIKVGRFGVTSIFSFYATKMITTGEGGMILTNDQEIYNNIIEIREMDKKSLNKIRFNYKMTDIQAALGLSQLKKLPKFIERRSKIAAIYNKNFSEFKLKLPNKFTHKNSVFYRYIILLENMEQIKQEANKLGIMCEKPMWLPLHSSLSDYNCPNADYIHNHALSIPIYPHLTEQEIEYIVENIKQILKKFSS